MKDEIELILALLLGLFLILLGFLFQNVGHSNDIENFRKEAFERGFMVKEVTKDDHVIYRWEESSNDNSK